MILLRDDPIIGCMMRTGYPPWIDADYEEIDDEYDDEEEEEEDDGE